MSRTPAPLPTEGPSAGGGDEFGDLFDYDVDDNDPFGANYETPAVKQRQADKDAALGIDEQVEVTRKPRAPRVKLDEDRYSYCIDVAFLCTYSSGRLCSKNGIPKLRSKAKGLKFRGKGHEVPTT